VQDGVLPFGLSDGVLELLASPLLGPCNVKQLLLPNQRDITGYGIATVAYGRFPGGFSRARLGLCALSLLLCVCTLWRCHSDKHIPVYISLFILNV
jgi:hypothetical protein